MAEVTWEPAALSRAERWRALDLHAKTIWLTGLPGSGKSTLAGAVERALVRAGRPAYRLDGDNLRHGICSGLGFSDADRDENVRRAGEIAHLFADAGVIAIVALVSPYADGRQRARSLHEARRAGLRRGLPGHAGERVRAARSEAPVRARPRGRGERADGRRRAVRAPGGARARDPARARARTVGRRWCWAALAE